MKKINERVSALGLKEVRLGVYICPGTGLFHVCRDGEWLNEESEVILGYNFFSYGVILEKEDCDKLFLDDGIIMEIEEELPASYGIFIWEGEKEKLMLFPERKYLEKNGNILFERMIPTKNGIIVEDESSKYCYFLEEKTWLSLEESDSFDEIIDGDDVLYCKRKEVWSMYFVDSKAWWEDPSKNKFFQNIDMLDSRIRVKKDGKYKLY